MGVVRIGGGQGFYGDGVQPVGDVLEAGVDYLVCEALAELTLAILQKDRQRDESLGFTRDLPLYVRSAIPYLVDGRTKLITNAGGINPVAAGRAVVDTLKAAGVAGLTVATVVGDDVRPLADELNLPDDTLFANVYLGARPIVEALAGGADVIVTGRVADASLFVAPLVHEHGWAWDDWDRLSAGVAVGHLLECSGSVAGGNYSGTWWENPDPLRVGFPIGEVDADGTAVITKSQAAGGMVTFDTVREQLLYEVHDPAAYLNPDATADFTSLTLTDLGHDRVRVSGTRGRAAPATYKGLVCRPAGWAGEATFAYSWPDAEAKARAAVAWVRRRAEQGGVGDRRVVRGVLRRERLPRPGRRGGPRRAGGRRLRAARGDRTPGLASGRSRDRRPGRAGSRRPGPVGPAPDRRLRSGPRRQADPAALPRGHRRGAGSRRPPGARRADHDLTPAWRDVAAAGENEPAKRFVGRRPEPALLRCGP